VTLLIVTVVKKRKRKMENEDKNNCRVKCDHCGYIFYPPYQDDCTCGKCKLFSKNLFRIIYGKNNVTNEVETKGLKIESSKKTKGTVKKKTFEATRELFFYGIVSKERIPIFYNDKKSKYILALTNDLDIISTSILSGTLDKMLIFLRNEKEVKEKKLIAHFLEKNGAIHILVGNFSDKDCDWIFTQVSMFFNDIVKKDKININKLSEFEKREISIKMNIFINKIEEAVELKVKFEKPNFKYIDKWLRLHYVGLSSESVGVISLLLDKKNILKFEEQKHFKPDSENDISQIVEEIIDFSESVMTAKIEVILASILGNMVGYPRWISIKSGFQKYYFLSFKKLENQFFLYCITEGNIEKLESLESFLYLYLKDGVSNKFGSSLKIYNKMKNKIRDIMEPFPERKFY
jgi:hypothetical protein